MNRREFCKTALNLGLFSVASSMLPWRTFAQVGPTGKPQFFILMQVSGGWDTSLATDPWTNSARLDEKDYFIEYRQDEILPFGNAFVGPALLPLQKYFNRMSIFNGIFMSANDGGHESATLYASSGNGQGNLGLLPLELEGPLFRSPFGTLADNPPFSAGKNKTIWDFSDIKMNGRLGGPDLLIDFEDPRTDLSQSRKAILTNKPRIDRFNQIFSQYKERTSAEVVTAAFLSKLSSSAAIAQIGNSLDTHSNHKTTHMRDLKENFENIAKFLDVLAAVPGVDANDNLVETNTLLDQTTVMVISEFTRTPALNGSGGKDHNPQCNSVITFAPGMNAGIYGASTVVTRAQSKSGTPYLAGLPLDLTTHEAVRRRENSFIFRPENVVATIARSMNVDPSSISKGLGAAQVLKKALK